jgi:hypothetical protein
MLTARLAERTSVRIAVYAVIATIMLWPLLGSAGGANEFRDAQVMFLHERAAVLTMKSFHELPLWDPYYCGGLYGLGAAQSRFASPGFLVSLLFGVERAEPILAFVLAILGMEGTYRWLRLRVTDPFAAARIAPIFALSGHFAVAYFRGWTNFFGFELVPWVLLGITLAARGRASGLAIASIAFALILGFGGTFAAPIIAVAATIEALRAFFEEPRHKRTRAAAMLVAVASFMLVVSMFRLLPLAETLAASPRLMAGTPGHPPKMILWFLVKSLEVKDGDADDPGSFWVGPAFLALVALGGADRKSIRALVIVILFVWLTAGYARKPALFALLRELPVFSALRYPERFLWVAILFACEPAANALVRLPFLGDGKRWRLGANLLLTLAVLATVGGQISAFQHVATQRKLEPISIQRATDFRQARGNRWLASHYDGLGVGSLSCWETHPVLMSRRLRGDLAAEEYPADLGSGTVKRVKWAPNTIVLKTSFVQAGRVFVNQNWHPGWKSSVGTVVSEDGLLAIDVPAGEHEVVLKFRPMSAIAGATTSAIALVALFFLLRRAGRGRVPFRRGSVLSTALLVLVPWAALAVFAFVSREPRFPPPALRNPNGAPAIVAEVPSDAKPIGAGFALPFTVEAAKIQGPNALSNLALTLYMRRTGSIPRTTGLFVHVVRREKDPVPEKKEQFFNADHQVLGGSFYLSDAPGGQLVQDAFGLHLGKAARGTYDVWVGMGHVSGRRGRTAVRYPGTVPVEDNMLKIATFVVR